MTAWRHDLITIQAKSIEIQVVYLTKNRELDRHMFHSIWKKMNGLMPRVKAILDVYCEVMKKDMNDDETRKALELFFSAQLAQVNLRKSATDVRTR